MAYSITYGYINSPGSSSDYITSGPYLAGAIRFTATRSTINSPTVSITCDIYAGFGSYSNSGSYTGYTIYARPWYGTSSYSTATAKLDLAMNNGSWSRTSNSSQRLANITGLTATGYPQIISKTNQSLGSINWTSGARTFYIYFAGANGYQAKSVSVACPEYHADVTISYDANGGSGAPASQTKVYGADLELRSGSPSRTGYTFIGWASSSTATTYEWLPGGILRAEGTRTLYAVWEPNTYTVNYNSNGGSGTLQDSSATYNTSFTPRNNNFQKTGYTFNNWNTSANGSGDIWEPNQSKTWTYLEGKTFYAQWNVNSYTLTIHANNGTIPVGSDWTGSGTTATKTLNYGTQYGNLPTPTRNGYNFNGWYTSADGGTQVSSTTIMGTGAEIYAHWTSAQYTVSYNMNGGSGTTPSSQTFYPGQSITLRETPGITKIKNNITYTAIGWNTQGNENQSMSTFFASKYNPFNEQSATFNSNNQLTLFIHWRGSTYSVSYNKNTTDSVSSMPGNSGTITAPTTYTIPSTVPTRTGYTFIGWGTQESGGTIYQPGDIYDQYSTIVLYAQWTDFKISFDSNYLQDYNKTRNQVAFGIEAADGSLNSHSAGISQGIYTTGIYVKSKILDEYGTGVISGELLASTINLALTKASYSSGIMGSINLSTAYTNNSITIPTGWYNYIYIPHRNGGSNGAVQSDNCDYGSMLLIGMNNSNGIFRVRRDNIAIEQFYTTNNAYHRTSIGTLDWGANPTYAITKGALAFWNGAYSGTSSNLTYCNKGAFGTFATKNSISTSDVTGLGNAATQNTYSYSSAYGGILLMKDDGVTEVGKYIDFHGTVGSGALDYDVRITATTIGNTDGSGKLTITAGGGLTYGGATIKSFGWTQIGSGSNSTSQIDFTSSTTNYNEIMVTAETLRNSAYHLFSVIVPSGLIHSSTPREIKLGGGVGATADTTCGAWGNIKQGSFTPVGVWINNTAFTSATTWRIYGR